MGSIRRRKIIDQQKAPESVDYGRLKSLIRDEVDRQVARKLAEVIKPLYALVLSNSAVSDDTLADIPAWAVELLADTHDDTEQDDPALDEVDSDFWGL